MDEFSIILKAKIKRYNPLVHTKGGPVRGEELGGENKMGSMRVRRRKKKKKERERRGRRGRGWATTAMAPTRRRR